MSRGSRRRLRPAKALVAVACVAAGLMASAGTASAVTLEGPWAPFNRCPVDAPEILAVQDTGNACVAAVSPRGTFQIGDLVTHTGASNLQFGAYGPAIPNTVGATLQADPATVPGGLLGIVVPSQVPEPLRSTLRTVLETGPLGVTAKVELAGEPSDFSLFGPFSGTPAITLPIKIHLQNLLLGGKCYIGSDKDPIVLHPVVTPIPAFGDLTPGGTDPNGFPTLFLDLGAAGGLDQVDGSFSVPTANGCGLLGLGLLDKVIDSKLGLPSPAGANKIVLEDSVVSIGGSEPDGQTLSDAWHAAVTG